MSSKTTETERLRAALQRIVDEQHSTQYIACDGYPMSAMDGTQRMQGIARGALGMPPESDHVCPSCFSGMFWDDEEKSCQRCGHGGAEILWMDEKLRRSRKR
jgi:hypothetical protein